MTTQPRCSQLDLLRAVERGFHDPGSWASWLDVQLPRPQPVVAAPLALDLFAGCGGLSLGFECAGFRTQGFEMKRPAVATYNANLAGRCTERMLEIGDPPAPAETVDVLVGGPPCQPFSQIGYQRGMRDQRDGFPVFLDAVRRLNPRVAIIENVRGLLFRNKDYLRAAAADLERFGYQVDARLLNTAHYGVPQLRERVVVVASRVGWEWPAPVVDHPVSTGVALGHLALQVTDESRFLTESMDRYVAAYEAASHCVRPRDLHMERPSRTVTCRNLGASTSDMLRIRLPDGRRRMLHIREGARLMSFPSWYEFQGKPYDQAEQIGNAVAPLLSLALAQQVMRVLDRPLSKAIGGKRLNSLADADPRKEKTEQALALMAEAGIALRELTPRGRERAALCLLALAHIRAQDTWQDAKSHVEAPNVPALRSRQLAAFRRENYGEKIADSSYDDVRRLDLAILEEGGFVQRHANKEDADTHDGTRGNALTLEALALLRAFRTPGWDAALKRFRNLQGTIRDRLAMDRRLNLEAFTLRNGQTVNLGKGPHGNLQRAVLADFIRIFCPDAHPLYVGGEEKKDAFVDEGRLRQIGLAPPARGERRVDIMAWDETRNWLFLIEAAYSSNPINPERYAALEKLTEGTTARRVYVTAFPDRKTFSKWLGSKGIAWKTVVWVAEAPEHCAQFDGARFLEPYE